MSNSAAPAISASRFSPRPSLVANPGRPANRPPEFPPPPLGLDRPLGRQRFQVAALVQYRLEQARDRPFLPGPFAQPGHRLVETRDRLDRAAVQARHLL